MAVYIIQGFTQINQFRSNANMFQGKGVANTWTYISKANMGVGQIAGNQNIIPAGANLINDPDALDCNAADLALKNPLGPSIIEVV